MSGTSPFGTYSFSVTDGYTDTSGLPLGYEKAATLCIPNRRIEHGVIERKNDFASENQMALERGINNPTALVPIEFYGFCRMPCCDPHRIRHQHWLRLE